jgi:hypothetical protein
LPFVYLNPALLLVPVCCRTQTGNLLAPATLPMHCPLLKTKGSITRGSKLIILLSTQAICDFDHGQNKVKIGYPTRPNLSQNPHLPSRQPADRVAHALPSTKTEMGQLLAAQNS